MTTIELPDSLAIAQNQYSEHYIDSVNNYLFEQQSADALFTTTFNNTLHQDNSLNIIAGSDSGLLIKFVIKHGIPKGARYIFIEPDYLIDTIRQLTPELLAHEAITLCPVNEWLEQAERHHIDGYIYNDSVKYHQSLCALNGHLEEYYALNLSVSMALEVKIHTIRSTLDMSTYMATQLLNISDNQYPAALLKNSFAGKTCVILGGGPSLNEHLDWIKTQQENIVIMAASRIAGILLTEQITPHIVFSVDPQAVSFDLCQDILALPDHVVFINAYYVAPKLISQWHGKSVYLGNRFPWSAPTRENNIEVIGPTVTNAAITAAVNMGFSQILLAGVDLCYSAEGKTHAAGTPEANAGPILFLDHDSQWVETYCGTNALSSINLIYAISEISEQAKHAREHGTTLVNLAKSAAKIALIDYKKTSDITIEATVKNTFHLLDDLIPDYNNNDFLNDQKTLLKKINHIKADMTHILALSKEAMELNKKLYKKNKNNEYNLKHKDKIDKIQKKLDEKYQSSTAMLKIFGLSLFNKFINNTNIEQWTDEEMEESVRVYYKAYIDSIVTINPLLEDAKKRINARIEEASPGKILQAMQQWKKDHQTGRTISWVKKHPENYSSLEPKTRQAMDDLIDQHCKELCSDTNLYNDIITTRAASDFPVHQTIKKIYSAFKQKNHENIQKIVTLLTQFDTQHPQTQSLSHLARAYMLVLQGKNQEALLCFKKVEGDYINEPELKEIFSLSVSLENYQEVEETLGKLAGISDQYAPQHALSLKLNNKVQQSIDVYTAYLNKNPEDISTWLKLGELFSEADAYDLARMAFDYILERDPENRQALAHLATIENMDC